MGTRWGPTYILEETFPTGEVTHGPPHPIAAEEGSLQHRDRVDAPGEEGTPTRGTAVRPAAVAFWGDSSPALLPGEVTQERGVLVPPGVYRGALR